jgi:hypothetical protein
MQDTQPPGLTGFTAAGHRVALPRAIIFRETLFRGMDVPGRMIPKSGNRFSEKIMRK